MQDQRLAVDLMPEFAPSVVFPLDRYLEVDASWEVLVRCKSGEVQRGNQPAILRRPECPSLDQALDSRASHDHGGALDLQGDGAPGIHKLHQEIAPGDVHARPVKGKAAAALPNQVSCDELLINGAL